MSTVVIGTKAYTIDGGDPGVLVFDFETSQWASLAHNRPFLGNHHAAVAVGSQIFVIGALASSRRQGQVQIYDVEAGIWTEGPFLPYPVHGSVCAVLLRGEIHVCGGLLQTNDGNANRNPEDCYRLHPTTLQWTQFASMPLGVDHAGYVTDGDHFFVFGGRDSGRNRADQGVNLCQKYTYDTNSWELCEEMPFGRGGTGKAVHWDGVMILMGGEREEHQSDPFTNSRGVYPQVATYDIVGNSWSLTDLPPMSTGLHGIDPVLRDQTIYVLGGADRFHSAPTTIALSLCLPSFS